MQYILTEQELQALRLGAKEEVTKRMLEHKKEVADALIEFSKACSEVINVGRTNALFDHRKAFENAATKLLMRLDLLELWE